MSTTTHTNANSVFSNPILLGGICDNSSNKELLCVMRSSRLGFSTAASRIWRSLDGIEPLLMLLAPTLELLRRNEDDEDDEDVMKVTLPAFSSDIFTRFDCYSTFVRKLIASHTWSINSPEFTSLKIESWSSLSLQVQRAPLLPNLEDLSFAGSFSGQNEMILWISTFVSPSVRTLNLCDFGYISDYLATVAVFSLLTQQAPELKNLSHDFRIVPSRHDDIVIEKSVSRLVLSPLACGYLHNSQHLTHLAVGGLFINTATLTEISCLPKLQHLSINQLDNRNKNLARTFNEIQLPLESFPSLRSIQLSADALNDIIAAWNVIPLVSSLTSVTLELILFKRPVINAFYDDEVLLSILPRLFASSPHIKELTLDGSISPEDSESLSTNLAGSSWIHMGRVSLSYLGLKNFKVDAASLNNVQRIWPYLVVLDIPEQKLALQHLIHLSQLPELKKIIAAKIEDIEQIPELQGRSSSPLQTIQLLLEELDQVWIKSAENVARFLLGLLPKLQQIVYPSKLRISQPDLKLLNMHIRMIRDSENHGKDGNSLRTRFTQNN
ncbi:hypothetical protein FRC12_005256 [Ceratobasidium sp. 428]|nr:hypothetical protein FRC12_005256 [Ceratobasidium sp. 428]